MNSKLKILSFALFCVALCAALLFFIIPGGFQAFGRSEEMQVARLIRSVPDDYSMSSSSSFRLIAKTIWAQVPRLLGMSRASPVFNSEDYVSKYDIASKIMEFGDSARPVLEKHLKTSARKEERWLCADLLGDLGNNSSIPVLTDALLSDSDAEVRGTAAESLGEIGDPASLPLLISTFAKERDNSAKKKIIEGIEHYDDEAAINFLSFALKSEKDPEIRTAAVGSLANFANLPDVQNAIVEAFMTEKDESALQAIVKAIGRMPKKACIPILMDLLRSEAKPAIRFEAAMGISKCGDKSLGKQLLEAFRAEKDENIKSMIGECLGKFRELEAFPEILAEFPIVKKEAPSELKPSSGTLFGGSHGTGDSYENNYVGGEYCYGLEDNLTNARLAWALGMMRDTSALQALTEQLEKSSNSKYRIILLTAIGRIDAPRARAILCERLSGDADHLLRESAAKALSKIKCEESEKALSSALRSESNSEVISAIMEGIAFQNSPGAFDILRSYLSNSDSNIRKAAISGIAWIGGKDAMNLLLDLLQTEKEKTVVSRIANALGMIGDSAALDAISALVGDQGKDSPAEASCWALGHIYDNRALPFLEKALERKDTVFGSAFALAEIRDRSAIPALKKSQSQLKKNTNERFACNVAITLLGDNSCVLEIAESIKKNQAYWERFAILCCMIASTDPERIKILENLCNDNSETLSQMAQAVLDGKGIKAFEIALSSDKEDDSKYYALSAMLFFDGLAEFKELVEPLLCDGDENVRESALLVLRRIEKQKLKGE